MAPFALMPADLLLSLQGDAGGPLACKELQQDGFSLESQAGATAVQGHTSLVFTPK